jgi:hypothetical protein
MPHPTGDPDRRPGRPQLRLIEGERRDTGKHALDEDAILTPIFATLARRRGRPAPVDPVERFRRDPLTAPLPVVVPARRRPGAHARPDPLPERPAPGRHALRRGAPTWLPH